ncbi:MAG: amino acid aminotransferase [Candidatus Taylorbacteria bacterium]|nr:amino acid aminotransferase [Candidatus Taylorbacteria bacterium]
MIKYCFLNDKIIPLDEAKVSVEDIGLLRGYGIYEGITTFNNKLFRLEDHLERFEKSAKALGLKIPYSREKIAEILNELVKKHGFSRTNLRIILTGGVAEGGIYYNEATPTFYVLAEEWKSLPTELYEQGASLITHEYLRTLPEMKTVNYIIAVSLQQERKKKNAIEILFTSESKALEAATSNFFMIKDNVLITPKDNVLYGITRKVVLELARDSFVIEEREVSLKELADADEVFITASYKNIVPIVEIDGKKVSNGKVGGGTQKIMKLFNDYTKQF